MKKTALVLVSIAAAGALFLPIREQSDRTPRTVSPEEELTMKQNILERDVAITAALCRQQCKADLHAALIEVQSAREAPDRVLANWQRRVPKMIYFKWRAPEGEPVEQGNIPSDLRGKLAPFLEKAEQAARRGEAYESETIHAGKEEFFVIEQPGQDGRISLTAVVQPGILNQLQVEQRKNLRIVPYPSDKRLKIESVDADTRRDVAVRHPEQNEGTSHYYKQEVVVKFAREPGPAELDRMCADISCTEFKKFKLGGTYVFSSRRYDAEAMMDYFRKNWNPVYTEPHYMYLTNQVSAADADVAVPNDLLFAPYQWNLPVIETLEGWNISKGSEAVRVAVVDTGVDLDHPDLVQNLADGVNIVNPDLPPEDDVGHGTHVAGVIAATVNNAEGVAGMSWYNKVMPVKVLDETGAGSTYSVAQGIIWATDNGARVINLSLGNYVDAEFLHDAIRYAYDRDVVLIAAAGNDNTETPGYPAAYPEVFAVAATDAGNQKAVFSNYGDYIDAAAPGENIASTYAGSQYAALSGTSMASPHAAALAAMIRSVNPDLTNEEVMEIMRTTVADLGPAGRDKYYGYGLIDVKKALESASQHGNSLLMWPRRFERSVTELLNR
jgi:hypothetical protein